MTDKKILRADAADTAEESVNLLNEYTDNGEINLQLDTLLDSDVRFKLQLVEETMSDGSLALNVLLFSPDTEEIELAPPPQPDDSLLEQSLLDDPATHFWLRDNIKLEADPVDLLHDAQLLVKVLELRLNGLTAPREKYINRFPMPIDVAVSLIIGDTSRLRDETRNRLVNWERKYLKDYPNLTYRARSNSRLRSAHEFGAAVTDCIEVEMFAII